MSTYRAYCLHKGWLQITSTGYVADASEEMASILPLTKLQAAVTHLNVGEVLYVAVNLDGVPAGDLMRIAAACMQKATDTANARITPFSNNKSKSACPECGNNTLDRTLITGTNPPQYSSVCSHCGYTGT